MDKDSKKGKGKKEKKPAKKAKVKDKVEKISRSKQLEAKRKSRTRKQQSSSENRRCSNGKPMPSLAELEKMFETSSEEDEPSNQAAAPKKAVTPEASRCSTPVSPVPIDIRNLHSPRTLQEISNKVIDFITHFRDTIILDEDPPSPPPKAKKKPDVAYIERTKDCEQLTNYKSGAVVGAGDNYKTKRRKVIDELKEIEDLENECPSKKRKSEISEPCNSIFNSKTDEIVRMLKAKDTGDTSSNGSCDSNKTVAYDCSATWQLRTFSPIPSTSTDNETFLKNAERFNESLIAEATFNAFNASKMRNLISDSDEQNLDEVQVVEVPCETVIVDDDDGSNSNNSTKYPTTTKEPDVIEIKNEKTIIIDDDIGDLYSSIINLDDYNDSNDVCEVIDVDDVIAQNEAVLNKYKKPVPKSITCVDLNDTIDNSPQHKGTSKVNCITPSNIDPIESIVTKFFENKQLPQSAAPNFIDAVYDSLAYCTDTITRAFAAKTSQPNTMNFLSSNLDIIDLDKINNKNCNSQNAVNVPTTQNNITYNVPAVNVPTQISFSYSSSNPDNPVILYNNVPILSSTSPQYPVPNQRPKAKSQRTKKLPAVQTPTPPSDTENQPPRRLGDCPICMENLSNQVIASTICGHIFCMECIKAAIKASGKKCPTCRKSLRGAGFHQIFL